VRNERNDVVFIPVVDRARAPSDRSRGGGLDSATKSKKCIEIVVKMIKMISLNSNRRKNDKNDFYDVVKMIKMIFTTS